MSDVRIGAVSAVDEDNRAARVRFDADNVTSGWLKVLYSPPNVTTGGRNVDTDSENKSDKDNSNESNPDRGGEIGVDVSAWLPTVGETVLCIYGDGFNADGYIIGGLR